MFSALKEVLWLNTIMLEEDWKSQICDMLKELERLENEGLEKELKKLRKSFIVNFYILRRHIEIGCKECM